VVMMHPEDMAEAGLQAEQLVDVHGRQDAAGRVARRFHVVPYDIPRGCIASYFPETNVLVPLGTRARISETPASKLVIVGLEPAE
jgi:anaerobic selenocysteine-containing dehydrogenase